MDTENKREERRSSFQVESILDLNSNNVWSLNEFEIAELWEAEKKEGDFTQSEEKLLNTIRLYISLEKRKVLLFQKLFLKFVNIYRLIVLIHIGILKFRFLLSYLKI